MGCNNSKDGANPSQGNAQGGDNAPKDKPEDGSAQQAPEATESGEAPASEQQAEAS